MPGSYQVTPAILGRRRATQRITVTPASKPGRPTASYRVSPPPARGPTSRADVTGPRPETLTQRPVIHDHQQEGADRLVVVSRCVSAAGIGFLVILFPPGNWALLAVGLPARSGSDPDGVSTFRTLKLRPGWVPSISRGRRCSPGLATITGPRLPHLSGPSLRPATTTHLNETPHHETSTKGSNDFTRPVFPSPDALGWNVSVLGFPPSFALRDYSRRTSGWGQAYRARA